MGPSTVESTYSLAEDPVIWFSGGQYHVLYDYPDDRVGYHLTSSDGIHNWTDQGLAYDPRYAQQIFSYTDGTVDHWYKMERPNVVLENGLITHVTFAVSDVDKNNQISAGTDHGSKVIVVPFDGVTFDKDTGVGDGRCGRRRRGRGRCAEPAGTTEDRRRGRLAARGSAVVRRHGGWRRRGRRGGAGGKSSGAGGGVARRTTGGNGGNGTGGHGGSGGGGANGTGGRPGTGGAAPAGATAGPGGVGAGGSRSGRFGRGAATGTPRVERRWDALGDGSPRRRAWWATDARGSMVGLRARFWSSRAGLESAPASIGRTSAYSKGDRIQEKRMSGARAGPDFA